MRGIVVASVLAACSPNLDLPPEDTAVCGNGVVENHEECDDGNRTVGDGCSASCQVESALVVRWSFATLAGAAQSCPSGATVDLTTAPAVGDPVVETFPCTDGVATLQRDDSDWNVVLDLVDHDGDRLGEVALPTVLAGGSRDLSISMLTDAGFVSVGWFNDQDPLSFAPCSDYGATHVAGTLVHGTTTTPIDVACTNPLVLGPFPQGSYSLDLAIGKAPIHAAAQVPAFSTVFDAGVVDLPVPQ